MIINHLGAKVSNSGGHVLVLAWGHPLAGSCQQVKKISRDAGDPFVNYISPGVSPALAPWFSFLRCQTQSAPVTHQDQGGSPGVVTRAVPLAAVAAPENRQCPARVQVVRRVCR